MSGSEADAIQAEIRLALTEDDMETVESLLRRLDQLEPYAAHVIRTILYSDTEAAS